MRLKQMVPSARTARRPGCLLKSICCRSSAGRTLSKATSIGGSAWRVMTEDNRGVGLTGGARDISDTSVLAGVAEVGGVSIGAIQGATSARHVGVTAFPALPRILPSSRGLVIQIQIMSSLPN
jgi:hypothetical protein